MDRPQARVTFDQIKREVALLYGLSVADLEGDSRRRVFVRPRQLSWLLAKRYTRLSFTVVGKLTGGRDHTTVLTGSRDAEARMAVDPSYRAAYERLVQRLGPIPLPNALSEVS
jgi:chromosomal replication initiator protein